MVIRSHQKLMYNVISNIPTVTTSDGHGQNPRRISAITDLELTRPARRRESKRSEKVSRLKYYKKHEPLVDLLRFYEFLLMNQIRKIRSPKNVQFCRNSQRNFYQRVIK